MAHFKRATDEEFDAMTLDEQGKYCLAEACEDGYASMCKTVNQQADAYYKSMGWA